MSATVSWHPVSDTWLKGVTSTERAALTKVFGEFPITLSSDALDKLNVMAVMYTLGDSNPYETLANAIVEFGTIEVTVSF